MLRHLVGLLAGIALAPVLWVAAAWSAGLLPQLADGDVNVATVLSAVVLCLTGGVCAYLVASRVSPLVAGAAGSLLAALSLWPIVHPSSMGPALSWLNDESFLYPGGAGLAVGLLLGTLLLVSATMPLRWRAAADPGLPLPGRIVAGTSRDRYRAAVREDGPDEAPWSDRGPVGDTVPDAVPEPPPARDPDDAFDGDPDRTTTPFRRGETGATWTPLDDEGGGAGPFRGRRR
ncbi:YIP1 family protein [Nocardiopsis sp. CT-R113]|uniref:YIP1 family protein n=1 Tax=Nocardiopsis codii TaxID=3065942 RepID=A0ABU7KFN6_9ACTN|nr:YIP1 family protein [Nocardiopsis sp. CT-R113]MEE2041060.1 YIP1 family protein [Nocardiopsis sp. CT-R113]